MLKVTALKLPKYASQRMQIQTTLFLLYNTPGKYKINVGDDNATNDCTL